MRLKPPQNFVPVRERVEIPGDLHAQLTDYARDYQATHGATITRPELLSKSPRLPAGRPGVLGLAAAPPAPTPTPTASPTDPRQPGGSSRSDS